MASAYSGLKVGQVMEAAIPISILAIGLARVYRRRSTLLENVILTGIGGTSGAVVAGAIFTLPALYTLHLDPHPLQTIFICLAGGCLGVLFLIPLRRYFVRETHGTLPYPEATAITEVLVTGERGGSQARLLIEATVVAGVYDFFVTTFQVWREFVDLQFVPGGQVAGRSTRGWRVSFDAVAFILGLGYVMGLRSSMVLCAGGILSNLVLVPLIWTIGQHLPGLAVYPGHGADRRHVGDADLPRLRAVHRRRRDRHGRHLRHHQVAARGASGRSRSRPRAFRSGEASGERTDRDIPFLAQMIGVVLGTLVGGRLLRQPLADAGPGRRWRSCSRSSSPSSSPRSPPTPSRPPPATRSRA